MELIGAWQALPAPLRLFMIAGFTAVAVSFLEPT